MKTLGHRLIVYVTGLLLLITPCVSRAADTFVESIDLWFYVDNGVDQGSAWRSPGFDDSGWGFGISEFGFGEGDEFTGLNPAPNGAPLNTAYFRTAFNVSSAANHSNVTIRLLRDDGAIVYLNGLEVFRSNMPTGAVNYATPALRSIEGAEESRMATRVVPASVLVSGLNSIAVELHQAAGDNADMSFALQLIGHRVNENQPPSANASFISVEQDDAVNFVLNAADPDSDPLTYTIVSLPQHGTLSGVEPNLIYTPNPGYVGPDLFSFQVTDGEWETEVASVAIDVTLPSNHPPVAHAQSVAVNEDGSVAIILSGTDSDGDVLIYTHTGPLHGTVSTGPSQSLIYQPAANYHGPDSFDFTVNDGNGGLASATVSIAVISINDAPIALAKVAPASRPGDLTRHLVILATNNLNVGVSVNGSGSSDIDGSLSCAWYLDTGTTPLGTTASFVASVPVGTHTLTLVVSDGLAETSDSVTVQVRTPCELVTALATKVQAASLKHGERNFLLRLLSDACSDFDAGNVGGGIQELKSFQVRLSKKVDPTTAQILTNEAQKIIDEVNGQ